MRASSSRSLQPSSPAGWGGPRRSRTRRACRARWGAEVWLKREDLAHTGAHKINNAIGQALLARRLGAQRIVAETGAGQHGVASAAACARARPALHRVHGRGGHGAPGAERRAHAPARRHRRAGHQRRPDAARRDRRGAARLGVRSARTPITCSARRSAASLSLPRARTAGRHRARGARADARRERARCPMRSSPASAAARTRSASSMPSSPMPPSRSSASRPAGAAPGSARTRRPWPRAARRAARQLFDAAAGRGRADPGDALGLRRARLSGRRTGARSAAALGRVRYETASDAEALAAVRECASARASCRRSRARTRWPARRALGARAPGQHVLVCLSGRGDKDMPTLRAHPARGRRRHESARAHQPARSAPPPQGRAGAGGLSDRRLPEARAVRRASRARVAAASRRGGDRRAVHRSDGRRRDHPALQPRGAAPGRDPALDPRGAGAARGGAARRCC